MPLLRSYVAYVGAGARVRKHASTYVRTHARTHARTQARSTHARTSRTPMRARLCSLLLIEKKFQNQFVTP